jgi:hypothetical protein
MSKRRPRPFPSFAVPSVRIVAYPIAYGWRYKVMPAGRAQVVSYHLDMARAVAGRYSRRIILVGPPTAFRSRRGG